MGVQSLWQILAPVKSEETIECLKGKKIAVDLAIWLVESQVTGMKMMQGVTKPHLRNLFFRVSNFLKLGVKLVFVIDGTPPELKWEEMARRNDVRLGGGGARGGGWRGRGRGRGGGGGAKKKSRSHFACWLKECQELLELMGVPCIQSKGEAEAMCAALNDSGLVDGCMTEDGDAFLYGARIVYRNLNMATGKVDRYSMEDVEVELGLDRRRLVALSILLGCDYLPKGVPGVGKEVAMKFMRSIPCSIDPLRLFLGWRGGCASTCLTNEERDVRKKSLRVEGFPNEGVIAEFLQNKERPPARDMEWKRPLHLYLQRFILMKMEWSVEYTQEKVIPLLTLFDLTHMTSCPKGRLHPASVVKLRVRQGVQCVEVKWHKPDEDKMNDEEEDNDPFYTTVEVRELFTSGYPDVMESFIVAKETKKSKGRGKKKKETSCSQQEGRTEEVPHVVVDTASKQPPGGAGGSMNLDQEYILKAKTLASQAESNHINQPRSREMPSSHGHEFERSKSPSQEELTHQHSDIDDKDMLMKLGRLSLQEQLEDQRTNMVMQDMDKKARQEKKCFRGKDLKSGKEKELLRNSHGDQTYLGSKSHPLVSASTYGAKERKQTKKNIVQVNEDSSTEVMEEVEESFIEVLPLSQRLGCSLRGFVPKSRKTATQISSDAVSKAGKSAGHFSLHDKSGLKVEKTFQQLSDDLQDSNPGKIWPVDSNLSPANDKVIKRPGQPSVACAGSEVPSIAIEHSARSPLECSMDKGHFMSKDAHSQNLNEVIDLTEDSPLNNKCMPAVYSAENTTIKSPRNITSGVTVRGLSEKKDGDVHVCPKEEVVYPQVNHVHSRLVQISKDHGNSLYSMKKDDSSFMKLDNSLAKFMEELSLVSNSSSLAVSYVEDNDSVFIVEDEEPSLDDAKQKKIYLVENFEDVKDLCQGTVVQSSSNNQEKLPEENNLVAMEQVTKDSKHTAKGDIDDSTELPRRETKNVKEILDFNTNCDHDSTILTEATIEVNVVDRECTRTYTPKNLNDVILDSATTASSDASGSIAKELCEQLQYEECNHEMGNPSDSIPPVKKAVKSKNGRVNKMKKRHKAMKGSSVQDSLIIEDRLVRLLQMMSPVQMISNPRSQEAEDPLSEEKMFMGPICVSPPLKSPAASTPANTKQTAPHLPKKSQAVHATSVSITRVPISLCTESSQDEHAYSEQTPLSTAEESQAILANADTEVHASLCTKSSSQDYPADLNLTTPGEPQAILANSASGLHASPCTKSSMPQSPTKSERMASTSQKEPCATINSAIRVHVSPSTNPPRLLRTQLMSMLNLLTPGNSPPIGLTMREKSQDSVPFHLRHQIANRKGKPQTRSRPVKLSSQENRFQEAIPDKIDGMPECASDQPNVSFRSQSIDEPKPKPRSLSHPTKTVLSGKRNVRSKPRSCSQPVRSHTRSRSKSSVKGSQKRQSLLAMEYSLAKILEGLSI